MADIKIIDNYRDLSIGDFQDILAICKDESLEEIDKQVKVISILSGADEQTILDLPILEYQKLAAKTDFLTDQPRESQRLADSYKIGKFELIPVKDIRKVNTAQYIDFQTFHKAGFDDHFVEILSCLLVPKGKKYNQDYDIIEVQDTIRRELNVYDALSLYSFFVCSCKESIKDILTSCLQEVKEIKETDKRETMTAEIKRQLILLETDGVGSQM